MASFSQTLVAINFSLFAILLASCIVLFMQERKVKSRRYFLLLFSLALIGQNIVEFARQFSELSSFDTPLLLMVEDLLFLLSVVFLCFYFNRVLKEVKDFQ